MMPLGMPSVPRDGDKRGGGIGGSESRMGADHSHSSRLFASLDQPLHAHGNWHERKA